MEKENLDKNLFPYRYESVLQRQNLVKQNFLRPANEVNRFDIDKLPNI